MVLAKNIVEILRPIFAREDLVAHGSTLFTMESRRKNPDFPVLVYTIRYRSCYVDSKQVVSKRAVFQVISLVCVFCGCDALLDCYH